jgi:beta-N-acetylhexosaminidase
MIDRRTFLTGSVALGATAAGLPLARAAAAAKAPTSLRQKVEQLFVISFAGKSAGSTILSLLENHAFGGVILYERNCGSAAQIRTLLSELQTTSRYPLLVCADQEGGKVVRIHHGAPVFPSEAVYGEQGLTSRVYADAAATARALRGLGLSMDLAPVVDVLSNPTSPIGQRSYGPHPQLDANLSVAAIGGYQQHGLAATAKHFIGLGHTSIDSHASLPTVGLSMSQLEQNDLIPFRAAIRAGVSTILVAHVALPRIDSVFRPASLSPTIMKGVIRGRLGFKGVLMTDSLIMGALPKGQEPQAAAAAFAAGADILLLAGNVDIAPAVFEEAIDRVIALVTSGRVPESRVDGSLARVLALKRRYPARIVLR